MNRLRDRRVTPKAKKAANTTASNAIALSASMPLFSGTKEGEAHILVPHLGILEGLCMRLPVSAEVTFTIETAARKQSFSVYAAPGFSELAEKFALSRGDVIRLRVVPQDLDANGSSEPLVALFSATLTLAKGKDAARVATQNTGRLT